MSLQFNGENMDTATVAAILEEGTAEELDKHYRHYPVLGKRSRRRVYGRDLPVVQLRFLFVGPAAERYARMTRYKREMETADDFILQVEPAPNQFYIYEDSKAARLSPNRARVVHYDGLSRVGLEVEAVILERIDTEDTGLGGIAEPEIGSAEIGLEEAL